MPIYEYKCPVCGNEEERLVKVEERDEQVCTQKVSHPGAPTHEPVALVDCGSKMEREEISVTAKMADQWKF